MSQREPILRPSSGIFLVSALVVFLFGTWTRRAPGFEAALVVLLDGDPDRSERLEAAQVVLEGGLARGDGRSLVLAATAAIVSNDAEGFARAVAALGRPAPERILLPESFSIAEACLGESSLEPLLQGMAAEADGRAETARLLYHRAAAAADLWNLHLAADLARAGSRRLR